MQTKHIENIIFQYWSHCRYSQCDGCTIQRSENSVYFIDMTYIDLWRWRAENNKKSIFSIHDDDDDKWSSLSLVFYVSIKFLSHPTMLIDETSIDVNKAWNDRINKNIILRAFIIWLLCELFNFFSFRQKREREIFLRLWHPKFEF